MAWRRIGDKPLSEPMLTRFTEAYMRHSGEMSLGNPLVTWWIPHHKVGSGSCFNIKIIFLGMAISVIKARRSLDHLSLIMGIPMLVRQYLYIEIAPWFCHEIKFWTHKTADCSLWADMGVYYDYFWHIDCVIMKLNCIMQQPGQGVCLCTILEMHNSLHTVHNGIAKLLVYHWYQTFDPCVHIHIWYKLYG